MNKLCFPSSSKIYLIKMYRSGGTLQKLGGLLYLISLLLPLQCVTNTTAELELGLFLCFQRGAYGISREHFCSAVRWSVEVY